MEWKRDWQRRKGNGRNTRTRTQHHEQKNRIESNQSDVNASMNKNIIFKLSMFNVFLESRYNDGSHKASARWAKARSHSLTFSILFGFLAIDSLIEFTITQFSSLNPYGVILFVPASEGTHFRPKNKTIDNYIASITVHGVWCVQTILLVGSTDRIHTLTELYEFNYCVNNSENAALDSFI